MDPITSFLTTRAVRRVFTVAVFLGLLVVFRSLLVLLVFFVAFERPLEMASDAVASRTRISRRLAAVGIALVFLGAVILALALGLGRAVRYYLNVRGSLPERIAEMRATPIIASLDDRLHGTERLLAGAEHYATSALHYATSVGHLVVYLLIGFILAVIYLIEHDELREFARGVDGHSLAGTWLRWFGHVADACSVTLQFQLIVAACNALLTFPVLLFVGIPHATTFLFMIFFSGMVPVVGNFVAGGILTLLAFQAKGWLGVGIFVGLTFVLHKLESYYLNPRLAARHVKLPGFVLIVSLLLFEHLLGFVGLFVSFPFLFVAARLRAEMRAESAGSSPATAVTLLPERPVTEVAEAAEAAGDAGDGGPAAR